MAACFFLELIHLFLAMKGLTTFLNAICFFPLFRIWGCQAVQQQLPLVLLVTDRIWKIWQCFTKERFGYLTLALFSFQESETRGNNHISIPEWFTISTGYMPYASWRCNLSPLQHIREFKVVFSSSTFTIGIIYSPWLWTWSSTLHQQRDLWCGQGLDQSQWRQVLSTRFPHYGP